MKQLLQKLFEYKDGNLIWKIKPSQKVNIGDIAGCVSDGYIQIQINKKLYKAHRLIWMFHNGDIETGLDVDHINRIKSDNRIENLRLATVSQNQSNVTKYKNNTSGYKGVSWDKRRKKWRAQINHNNKKIHIGYFDTPELAHAAYIAAAAKLQGEFACWE